MRPFVKRAAVAAATTQDGEIRQRRWELFVRLFALTCLAVALDVITTYIGIRRIGYRFEQNGIALYLIRNLGWDGLTAFLALACAACVRSFKLVYWHLSLEWGRWLNVLVAVLCLFRWVVVTSDILWLMR